MTQRRMKRAILSVALKDKIKETKIHKTGQKSQTAQQEPLNRPRGQNKGQ